MRVEFENKEFMVPSGQSKVLTKKEQDEKELDELIK
jgi:hypothetical protein